MSELELDPGKDLKVDMHDLSNDFSRIPLFFYRYGLAYQEAKEKASLLEAQVKEVQGAEYLRIKSEGEKVTEAHMTALLQVSKAVKFAKEQFFAAEKDAGTLRSILDALSAKKESLITIAANNRAENK